MDLNIDENLITELFRDSEEPLLIIDKDKNILHKNNKTISMFGNISSSTEIEHFFSFDICILDNRIIFDYTPFQEALWANEKTKSEVLFQTGDNTYKKFQLRSFKNNGNTVIILSNISSQSEITEKENFIMEYKQKILELETANKGFSQLQEKAQNLAVRTGLINRISTSIRDSLDLGEIIQIALSEISTTLGLDKGYFSTFDQEKEAFILKNSWNLEEREKEKYKKTSLNDDFGIKQAFNDHKTVISAIMTDPKTNNIQPRLAAPVLYHDGIPGILVFYHLKKTWHEEEISLIEGLISQLVPAINRAEMFQSLIKQKNELEEAILQLKKAQAQLVQSEKMASLGQLVAGVAHEINTPLGAVNSNNSIVQKCLEKIKDETKNKDIITILENTAQTNAEAIKRINNLVKSLKNFARLDEAECQETDIHEGIKSTLMLINHEIKNRIEIITEFGELPPVKCYPNQLNQVFMNILVNAYQSIESNGKIIIKTKKQDESIVITISDTGKGIPQADISRIFDPGFTTKGVGVGTGLGLSICYQIIEKHNGKISVESNEEKETTFKIEIPIVKESSLEKLTK